MDRSRQERNNDLQPILQSLKGMQRAQAPEGLFGRVMEEVYRPVLRVVPMPRIGLAVACLIALVGLNIALLLAKQNPLNNTVPVMEYYGTSSEYGYSY